MYFERPSGQVFQGNQHVTTSALSDLGKGISKYSGPIGYLIDGATIGATMYSEGGIGPQTAKAAAGAIGGTVGGEIGALAGAKAGVFLGTALGGPAGGIIGGIAGGIGGGLAGGSAAESLIEN